MGPRGDAVNRVSYHTRKGSVTGPVCKRRSGRLGLLLRDGSEIVC